MDDDESEFYGEEGEQQNNGGSIVWGIIIGIVIASLFWGIGKNGKYEGQTAEEWFNDYDFCDAKLQNYNQCVEGIIPNIDRYCSP